MESNKNIMSIDADECKKFHPRYKEIQQDYPQQAHDMLKGFSGKLKDAITEKALNERFNVLIESTFRDPQVPIKILSDLKNHRYERHILIQTCKKSVSWQSCLDREKVVGRAVNKDFHDNVCDNLAKNIKIVNDTGLADSLEIYARIEISNNDYENKQIYSSKSKQEYDPKAIHKFVMPVTAKQLISGICKDYQNAIDRDKIKSQENKQENLKER